MIENDQAIPISFKKLQNLLSVLTSNEVAEINLESHLEEDLAVNLKEDLPRLLTKINQEFAVDLKKEDVLQELEQTGETVGGLAKLIDDECELG